MLLLNLVRGHLRRHRLEGVLCLVGVVLGVAVVVGIDAAVGACVRSFSGAVSSLAERSTHSIFAESGPIADQAFIDLLHLHTGVPLAPVIDRRVLIGGDRLARLIGIDVFSEKSLRSFTQMQSKLSDSEFRRFMTEPGTVVLVKRLAEQLRVKPGDTVSFTAGAKRTNVTVIGVVEPTGVAASQLSDVVLADLSTAQELTGSIGTIDRVDTILDADEQAERLRKQLPAGLMLRSTSQQSIAFEQLIGSYKLNLNALSLMGSFVAVFIVYNAMLISVQQRATSLGILRCLGSSRWQLGGIYFVEAIAYAVVGGAIGVVAGWGLSAVLVKYIATTINDLYAAVRPAPVALDVRAWAGGMGIAVFSCVAGAAVPLANAARTMPINAFRSSDSFRNSGRWSAVLAAAGLLLLAAAWSAWKLPGESPLAGFVMAGLVAVGFALCCPGATRLGSAAVSMVARRVQSLPLQMAGGSVGRMLGITGVAVAATMLAMSMNIGIRTMVSSFRHSLDGWMDRRFAADVFVAADLSVHHKADATLDPAVVDWVSSRHEVASIIPYRSVEVPIGGKNAQLLATDVDAVLKSLPIKSRSTVVGPMRDGDVIISEPLAGRVHATAGGELAVPTAAGERRFFVRAVYFDFGTERGQLMVRRSAYLAYWHDPLLNAVHVTVKPGLDRRAVAAEWKRQLVGDYPVAVDSYDAVKVEAMTVFDRTFRVTIVLTWLSGGVAFCGLAGSLLALSLARRRDYGVLAAVGMSARQTAAWVLGQGLILAVASAVVAPVAGTVLAYVLAYVIQYRSFGWSIPTRPEPRFWAENLAMALVAAAVAAVYPVWRLRAMPPAVDLKSE